MNWHYWDVSPSERFILEKQKKTMSSPRGAAQPSLFCPLSRFLGASPQVQNEAPDSIMAVGKTALIASLNGSDAFKGQPEPRRGGAEPATHQSPSVCFFGVLFISGVILVVSCPQIGWFPSTYVDEEGVQ